MHRFYTAAALALTLMLAGCYVSDKPFIASSQADTPYPARATYVSYKTADKDAAEDEEGTVTLSGGVYKFLKKGSDIPDYETFKSIGGGLYISQIYVSPSDVAASKLAADPAKKDDLSIIKEMAGTYFYFLVRIDGNTIYDFGLSCEPDVDAKYVKSGFLDHIDKDAGKCFPKNLAGLVGVFREKAIGAKPKTKLVISART